MVEPKGQGRRNGGEDEPAREGESADDWIGFWNRPQRIYANRRHLECHYRQLLEDLRPYLPASPGGTVLDFGCGDALAAEAMAERVGMMLLFDAAPTTRARLAVRFAGHPRIRIVSGDGLPAQPPQSVDLALVISVVQYLDRETLEVTLATMKRLLKPDGALLIADVIDPDTPLIRDVTSQLRFAARNGFALSALGALAGVYFSDYRRIRLRAGFATYRPPDFLEILHAGGFAAERLARNLGPSAHRHAFLARPLPARAAVERQTQAPLPAVAARCHR